MSTDRIIGDGFCGRERPDFLWDCGGWWVVLEVDENEHMNYAEECEENRMKNIAQTLGGGQVWFLRYNPDRYKVENIVQDPPPETRHQHLMTCLKEILNHSPPENSFIRAKYLYYSNSPEDRTVQFMED